MSVLPHSIVSAIARFDSAAQSLGVMKDGTQPDNWYTIVHQHENARLRLERAIEKAIGK